MRTSLDWRHKIAAWRVSGQKFLVIGQDGTVLVRKDFPLAGAMDGMLAVIHLGDSSASDVLAAIDGQIGDRVFVEDEW